MFKGFHRWLRFQLFRVGRLGKLKITAVLVLLAATLVFHLVIALCLANDEAGDSKVYVQIAANVIDHGIYSRDAAAPFTPTFIRTPGYPLFLAGIFKLGGIGNETAVRIVQAFLFWLACIFTGMIAAEWVAPGQKTKAFVATFILAGFCPFIAIYTATILSEVPTMFLLAVTILAATYAFKSRKRPHSLVWWGIAGVAAGLNALVRPDAGLFAFGIGLTLVFSIFFRRTKCRSPRVSKGASGPLAGGIESDVPPSLTVGLLHHWPNLTDRFVKGIVFSIAFILPLVPWTIRNEAVFGVFQPLSPAHAEMPGEFVPQGYYRWVRTWIDDEAYIDPALWRLEIQPLRIEDVPEYAFSSADEKRRVAELFDAYNSSDPDHPPATKNASNVVADDNNTNQASPGGDDDDEDDSAATDDNGDDQENDSDVDQQQADSSTPEEWNLKITPEVDAQFAALARERIARDPWCYYICLPAKRSVSMWFDTHSDWYPFNGELFPLEDLDHKNDQQIWLPMFAGLNLIYTFLSFAGLWALYKMQNTRSMVWLFLVLAIGLPRIVFFGTIENPEPRYLIELFIPAAILGGIFLAVVRSKRL